MTEVKGTALAATLRYLDEKYGVERRGRIVAALPDAQRTTLDSGVVVSAWYPLDLLLDLMKESRRQLGAEAPTLFRDMGRASAKQALTTIYRIFFKVGSPQFMVSKAAAIFKTYYSTGELRAEVAGPGHAVLELHGFQDPARELCERLVGWMEGTLELAGAREIRVAHARCAAEGAESCRFEGFWR
jgi:uncharacterized protein (TIGR02265 family)